MAKPPERPKLPPARLSFVDKVRAGLPKDLASALAERTTRLPEAREVQEAIKSFAPPKWPVDRPPWRDPEPRKKLYEIVGTLEAQGVSKSNIHQTQLRLGLSTLAGLRAEFEAFKKGVLEPRGIHTGLFEKALGITGMLITKYGLTIYRTPNDVRLFELRELREIESRITNPAEKGLFAREVLLVWCALLEPMNTVLARKQQARQP